MKHLTIILLKDAALEKVVQDFYGPGFLVLASDSGKQAVECYPIPVILESEIPTPKEKRK